MQIQKWPLTLAVAAIAAILAIAQAPPAPVAVKSERAGAEVVKGIEAGEDKRKGCWSNPAARLRCLAV